MEVRQVCVRMSLCVCSLHTSCDELYMTRRAVRAKRRFKNAEPLTHSNVLQRLQCITTGKKESERAKDEVKALKQKQM